MLAQHFNQPGTFANGDLNGDGTVNFQDLVIVAQNYNHTLPQPADAAANLAPSVYAASADASILKRRTPQRRHHLLRSK